ncbi:MAG: AfsR/SARP family transcriptional regulator [Acidimicrobiales bacterium]
MAAAEVLEEARALGQGPALAEFAFEPFARAKAARLEELRAVAEEDRLEAVLATGGHDRAVADLEVAVGVRPRRERLWGLLMLALCRSGRQVEALLAFARAGPVLTDELGMDPGPELRRLEADMLAQSPEVAWVALGDDLGRFAAPTPATPSPTPWRQSLVGRDETRATLDGALAEATGERFCEASLCLLRSELAVIGKPPGWAEAQGWLRRAVDVADRPAAVPLRRRAGTRLAGLEPAGPRSP